MSIRSPLNRPLSGIRRLPLGLALLAPACPTLAQETMALGLPSIEVTAAKTARDAFEIPDSVSILERPAIEREQPTNLGDLLKDMPNVAVGGGPRGQGQTVTIRGLSDERILFLIDGARQNFVRGHSTRIFIEPDVLARVEVLRGPASALWGSGAMGGVVALRTLDAADLLREDQTLGGRIKVGYQDASNQWLTNAGVYGATADGQLDYLFDLAYRDGDDVRLGDGTDLTNSGFERLSGLAKGTWSPDGINSVGLSFMAFDQDGAIPSNPQTEATEDNLVDNSTLQQNLSLTYRHEDPDNAYLHPSLLLYRNTTDIEERRLSDGRRDETRLETLGLDLRNSTRLGDPERCGQPTVSISACGHPFRPGRSRLEAAEHARPDARRPSDLSASTGSRCRPEGGGRPPSSRDKRGVRARRPPREWRARGFRRASQWIASWF